MRYACFGFASTLAAPQAESSLFFIDQFEDVGQRRSCSPADAAQMVLSTDFSLLYTLARQLPASDIEVPSAPRAAQLMPAAIRREHRGRVGGAGLRPGCRLSGAG